MKKRSAAEMFSILISVAKADDRIRAVILNGSRTNKRLAADDFQDFDVIYAVKELASFRADADWIDVFGERLILQMPNDMFLDDTSIPQTESNGITYLMLFKDLNRIDLNLVSVQHLESCNDSLHKVLLDKDNLLNPNLESSDKDYWVKEPSQQQFKDCCNEFWWVSTYVVKGLARDEPLYAKEMLDVPVRAMFMRMLAWYAGSKNAFTINTGKCNRHLKGFVSPDVWHRILQTYSDATLINISTSLAIMSQLFHQISIETADKLALSYDMEEANNVQAYIKHMSERIKILE